MLTSWAVPAARGGCQDEFQVCRHTRAAGLTGIAERERAGFGRIVQQPFVEGPPPWAAGPGIALWIQQSTAELPAHEHRRCPAVRKISVIHCAWNFIQLAQQRQSRRGIVPDTL